MKRLFGGGNPIKRKQPTKEISFSNGMTLIGFRICEIPKKYQKYDHVCNYSGFTFYYPED